jgi:hydroxymethylglutaryl-CoA lyase
MKIIECSRDAMQGLPEFISTEIKISYINQLLKVGFDTIDFGSFVSPKAIPQMRDTARVLEGLDLKNSPSGLLAIVANLRGAQTAADIGGIDYLGFPLSLSETFQLRNTNRTIDAALITVGEIQNICSSTGMRLVTYLSMGFGNPYDDPYHPDLVGSFVERLVKLGVEIISLADTIGVSDRDNITHLFESLMPTYPMVEFGAHLHTRPESAREKIAAAYHAGCRRFDSALKGYGGCPMAQDQMVGNVATEVLIDCLEDMGEALTIDRQQFKNAVEMVSKVFY